MGRLNFFERWYLFLAAIEASELVLLDEGSDVRSVLILTLPSSRRKRGLIDPNLTELIKFIFKFY